MSKAAVRDLQRIRAEGEAEHGAAISSKYMAGFDRLFALLREQPYAGQERPDFKVGLRSLSHRPYRLLYRVTEQRITISRILHHARDMPRALRGEQ